LLAGTQAAQALSLMHEAGLDASYPFVPSAPDRFRILGPQPVPTALRFALAFEGTLPASFLLPERTMKSMRILLAVKDTEMREEEAIYRHGVEMGVSLYMWRVAALGRAFDADRLTFLELYEPPAC